MLDERDRNTEEYLDRIRKTIEESNRLVEQVGLRVQETGYAAGIGGGYSTSGGSVEITGGRVSATSGNGGGACIGAGYNGTYGDVAISGGTVIANTDAFRTLAIGDGYGTDGFGKVTITGGSVNAVPEYIHPAPSNTTVAVYCVTVSNLTANAAVALDGLPPGYGTTDIYANADGNVYLWLPAGDWSGVKKKSKLLSSAPVKKHTIAANGYRYDVFISNDGVTEATKGEALELETLKILDFAVEDGWLAIRVSASPTTWMFGFAETLDIYASETLPIPDSDESKLDLAEMKLTKEDGDNAIFVVPLGEKADCRFFKVRSR